MSDKPSGSTKPPSTKPSSIVKPRNGTSVDRLSRATQRSASRDSMKSRDPSNCTSPTKELSRKLPPIKAPVGLAKGPDLTNVRSKIGSLQNVGHKPVGGEKKVITQKLEWQAKPRIGSLDYVKHRPAGGGVKIENKKLEWKAKPKVGSLDNVKHKPGGGQVNIFDEKYTSRSSTGGRSPSENRSISPTSTTNSKCNTPTGGRSPLPSVSSKDGKENKQNESTSVKVTPKTPTDTKGQDSIKSNSVTSVSSKLSNAKVDENNNESGKVTPRPNSLTSTSSQSVKG